MSHGVFQTLPSGPVSRPEIEDEWERVSVFLVLPPSVPGETHPGEVVDISHWDVTPDKGDLLSIGGRYYPLPVPRWKCRDDGSAPECWFYLDASESFPDGNAQ